MLKGNKAAGFMEDALIKEKDRTYDVDGGVIGACATNERRQLNAARAIRSHAMGNTWENWNHKCGGDANHDSL